MTTTASKHGLRAKATASRAKHAQKTALPPRPGKVADAIETIREGDSASWRKAVQFIASIKPFGWNTTSGNSAGTERAEDVVEVTATRGDETIWISWTKGTLTTEPMPTYTIATRTVRLRNASAAKQYAARTPEVAEQELSRVANNKAFKRKPSEPKAKRLPFDPATATDIEVIEAIAGKKVTWHSRLREATEEAVVHPNHRRITIVEHDKWGRVVNFLCPNTGYRAFRLADLLRVGGSYTIVKRSGGRITQSNKKAKAK